MINIGDRIVGDGAPCFITFEAGPTIDSLETGKQLISHAAEAGVDAIKFQIVDPDRLLADKDQSITYGILLDRETEETEEITESVYDIMCRRVLSKDEWHELKRHSDSLGLAFFATALFEEDLNLITDLKCNSIKIASADVDHLTFIKAAAQTGLCLQLDTGNSTLGEIETAIDLIQGEGNNQIIIHQCPSGYPAYLPSINLNMIKTLKQMFSYPVAYSDHSPGATMDIAAVAMGANLVEKTISLDRTTRSAEHMFSIEPPEMSGFIQTSRDVETVMGSSRRIFPSEEREKRVSGRRSIFIRRDLPAGHKLAMSDIDFRRPGDGIAASKTDMLLNKPLLRDIKRDHKLEWSDVQQ